MLEKNRKLYIAYGKDNTKQEECLIFIVVLQGKKSLIILEQRKEYSTSKK